MNSFDHHQFESRGVLPVSATTGIAFSDYGRMHTEYRAQQFSWVPPFANNTRQLQHVILRRAWRFLHCDIPMPEDIDRVKLNQEATAKALKGHEIAPDAAVIQHQMHAHHKMAVRRAGGYMELQAAIAYRAWKLGQNSPMIADSVGMSPWAVRAVLNRLRHCARELGYDTGRCNHSAGKPRAKKNRALNGAA
jgi:hypothetical protein